MKILITGAAGFLGSRLVLKLIEADANDHNYHIRCFVRVTSNLQKLTLLKTKFPEATIEIVTGDMTSKEDLKRAVEGVNVIYHLAASLGGSPAEMFYNTCVGSELLLDAIKDESINRMILVSSFGVYEWAGLKQGTLINENIPLESNPAKRDIYSHTKLVQEELFKAFCTLNDIPLVITRPGVIYGPGGPLISARVGVDLFGVFLHLGGKNILPLTYVDNCAEAIVLAGSIDGIEGEDFNIVDNDSIRCAEYLKLYKKYTKKRFSLSVPYPIFLCLSYLFEKYCDYSDGQLPDEFTVYKTKSAWKGFIFSNKKARTLLKWTPKISFKDGIKKAFDKKHAAHT